MNNILFFNTTKGWGGGEKWHFDMIKYFHTKNYNVYAITNKKSELQNRISRLNIHKIGIKVGNLSFLNIFKIMYLYFYFKRNKIDVVVLNLSLDLKVGGLAAKLAGVKKIIYRRGSAIPIKNKWLNRFLLKKVVTSIIANSCETKKTIIKNIKDNEIEKKIKVIYNGVDVKKITDSNLTTNIRDEFCIDSSSVIAVAVGRLSKQKGYDRLLRVVYELKEKKFNFKVIIVGEGKERFFLESLVKKYNIEKYIIFAGFRNDVYSIIKESDFMVHTAYWEGFGYVLVEALASKKPIVAIDVSNISEIINTEKLGYLSNESGILEKLEKMIVNYKKFNKKDLINRALDFDFTKKAKEVEEFLCG